MLKIYDSGNAQEQEVDGIRKLLWKNQISFYETPSTGRTFGAMWVRNEKDFKKARMIIQEYTNHLIKKSTTEYKKQLGEKFDNSQIKWFISNLKTNKALSALIIGSMLFVIWHSIAYLLLLYGFI